VSPLVAHAQLKERSELKLLTYLMLRLIQKDKSVIVKQPVIRNIIDVVKVLELSFQAF
jgi:hypothetical protein